jgi:hypothetical protein
MLPNMIVVKYVDEYIYTAKGEFNVQFCGYKDKTPMLLEVWRIPCKTTTEAKELRDRIAKNKMILTNQTLRTLKEKVL